MKKGFIVRLEEIGESLSRLFAGRVRVRSLPSRRAKIASLAPVRRDTINVERLDNRQNTPVMRSLAAEWRHIYPRRMILALAGSVKIRSVPLRVRPPLVKGVLVFGIGPTVNDATERIKLLPQVRGNRVRYLKERPFVEGSGLIALFSPIIKDALLREVLERERGVLFVWYDVSSDAALPYMLALFRRLDASQGDIFSWRWLPGA
jgi:hypothetical protein